MEHHHLVRPPEVLHVSRNLLVLGYAFDVLYIFAFDDPWLIDPDRMTSRLFLNLRSAGSSTPNHLQDQLATTFPLGKRQAMPPESVQVTSSPALAAVNLDTTLFAMVSGVDRSTFSDQEQII